MLMISSLDWQSMNFLMVSQSSCKPSSRWAWLESWLTSLDFKFVKREDSELIVAQVYVDDIIFGSTKDELAHSFSKLMQVEFEMSMIGELTHFLGFQIRQQDLDIFLSQSKYVKNLVKKFGLESASSIRTPMSPNVKLTVYLLGKSVNSSLYRSIIGSLLYLTASRPNISYSVGVC